MEPRTSSEREERDTEAAAAKEPERHALGVVLGVLRHVFFTIGGRWVTGVVENGGPGMSRSSGTAVLK